MARLPAAVSFSFLPMRNVFDTLKAKVVEGLEMIWPDGLRGRTMIDATRGTCVCPSMLRPGS